MFIDIKTCTYTFYNTMTVYFISCVAAALRLNGAYAGIIDEFARRVDGVEGDVFAEAVPSDNRHAVNFMLGRSFLSSPPPFADVYMLGGDALVRLKKYAAKDDGIRLICQARIGGNLVTVCRRGAVMLCVDGADGTVALRELDEGFARASAKQATVGGRPVLCISAEERLLVVSEAGKVIFCNPVKSYSCGDMLGVTVDFATCAGAVGECGYSYDGDKLTLVSGRTVETRPVPERIKHFAFFESVLIRGDSARYLCPALRDRAGELGAYLGEFVDVIVPPQKFYELTGEERAAGLVRPVGPNLFRVSFFAADMRDGLVENIREVEYPPG